MRVLVTSERDIASQTIRDVLIEEHGFRETGQTFEGHPVMSLNGSTLLVTSSRDLTMCDHLEEHFKSEVFVFCSRHRAQSGRPALLVHSTGNFGNEALFGGSPRQLSVSIASLVSSALTRLQREQKERGLMNFDVTMEVTHHGPTSMETPLLFVELGSDEACWRNREGARAVAAAALECTKEPITGDAAIGFGGTHYASKFTGLALAGSFRIGHIAPKYALDDITDDVVHQMVERAREKVSAALIDWKGTNAEQRARIMPMIDNLGLEIVRARGA
ncbi:MAG: hypothetical protein C4K49_11380 [Candidatus Thorarchaeota archaeon]|nr:MAG: hypothetical protein C4K49_11380 [Candidatus Thorarchaeota archaeon]